MPTILGVDDNPDVLKMTALLLQRNGYAVLRATNGVQALMFYASYRERLDAVLTDVDMPEMNGIELAARIRANYPAAKILFMSGCLPAGATLPAGYRAIKKPFNAKELIGLLSEELAS
jgi:two-component system sensor histidine kinase EvgS